MREETDKQTKDYIIAIRRKRNILYEDGKLPVDAIIETTKYKPVLWKINIRNQGDLREG